MNSIARYGYHTPFFEVGYISTFFIRNEIFSEDIRKCENVLLFAFLILHSYNSGVTRALNQGGKLRETGHCTGLIR